MEATNISNNETSSQENKSEEEIRLDKLTNIRKNSKHAYKYSFNKLNKTYEIIKDFDFNHLSPWRRLNLILETDR